jgi:hypothetical protein
MQQEERHHDGVVGLVLERQRARVARTNSTPGTCARAYASIVSEKSTPVGSAPRAAAVAAT